MTDEDEDMPAEIAMAPWIAEQYAEALIVIAAAFHAWDPGFIECAHCDKNVRLGCNGDCPGLLARRALGVA